MLGLLARRGAWSLLILFVVATLTFFLSRVVPADPAAFLAGQNASPEAVARIRAEYGLDRPLLSQYVAYMGGLLHGDFGRSIRTNRPVAEDLRAFLPATLELLIFSFVLYLLASWFLAILAVRWRGGWVDGAIRVFTMLGSGIPVFWLGMALQFVFFYRLGWLPIGGRFPIRAIPPPPVTGFLLIDTLLAGNLHAFGQALAALLLPAAAIVINLLAVGTRMSRAALITEYARPYVRTARGKGAGPGRILYRHVLRNAIAPVLAATSIQFGYMISWVILVEVIFDWPGIGLYAYQSFEVFDYAPVVALAIVSTLVFLVISLGLDLLYPWLDPRMREATS
ncbi:MAG TPA: ABC transporter permease [Acetobacteraceae bacterium]|nr:ABC transporter permease [Acetobacteraceae bacterium]